MVVAEVEADGRFHVLDRAKDMVRMGGRTHTQGLLSVDAMDNGVRTLAAFRTLADRLGVTRVQAVATSAVREAANGGDFIRRVKNEVGWRVRVIQGLEEARLIYLGVRHATDLAAESPTMILDVGGGSVELILVEDGAVTWMDSLKLGVARLTDRFLPRDPPRPQDLAAMTAAIDGELDTALSSLASAGGKPQVRRIVGTSGTMLNLIAMAGHRGGEPEDGRPRAVVVDAAEFSKLRRTISRSDRAERLRIKGLDARRVDLIVAGVCVADRIVKRFAAGTVVPCTWALREGVLLDFIARHQKGIEELARYDNPRTRSVMRLARHLGESSQHGSQVARLAMRIYDQLSADLKLPEPAREWLEYASQLHDIGHHISHKNHHRHSHYLIANGELLGFEPYEVDVISLVARYHRKGTPKETDAEFAALATGLKPIVRTLSAILRVADSLDRSHFGVVQDLQIRHDRDAVTFVLDTGDNDAALEIWEAEQRAKPLRQVLGVELRFEVLSHAVESRKRSAR